MLETLFKKHYTSNEWKNASGEKSWEGRRTVSFPLFGYHFSWTFDTKDRFTNRFITNYQTDTVNGKKNNLISVPL